MEHSNTENHSEIDCELCIVGAGIGGLNALHSATCYLKPTDKVVLVDAKPAAGGMWQDTYDYVRLHQPHPMFTVGNIPWKKELPPAHLADKQEVNDQFGHCLHVLSQRVDLQTLFEHQYLSHEETESGIEVVVRATGGDVTKRIRAKRLIKAIGINVKPLPPLPVSSKQAHSISPNSDAILGPELESNNAPILIVGGGKTAMDTAHALIQRFPNRDIRMFVGAGVMFSNRDQFYTEGWQRWLGGTVVFEHFLDMALHFDGRNIEECNQYRFEKYGLSLSKNPKRYFVGFLSEKELAEIKSGLSEVVDDYFSDIVDTEDGPRLQLRSGRSENLPAGSWVINCTGYIGRQRASVEPYVSESGRVLSISMSSMPFFLTSFVGYYLTHLMYRDQLLQTPLYVLDPTELVEYNASALGPIAEVVTVLNILVLMKALPLNVFNDCLLDFNRWHPLPRRLPILLWYTFNNERFSTRLREALDQFKQDSGIRMGVLPYVGKTEVQHKAA